MRTATSGDLGVIWPCIGCASMPAGGCGGSTGGRGGRHGRELRRPKDELRAGGTRLLKRKGQTVSS